MMTRFVQFFDPSQPHARSRLRLFIFVYDQRQPGGFFCGEFSLAEPVTLFQGQPAFSRDSFDVLWGGG